MSDSLPSKHAAQPNLLIEACVSSAADAISAIDAGAHRIELCAALEVGGLTPSIGLIDRAIEAVKVPVMVMIRPRVGDFTPTEDEFATMLADVAAVKRTGAAGVVFGLLKVDRAIDRERTECLVANAEGLQTVFHRAIDFALDPVAAAQSLADLGVTRVLSSGGARTAIEGAATLRRMAESTAGRLEVLPGGGVRAANIAQIVRETGSRQVHLGPAIAIGSESFGIANAPSLADTALQARGAHRALDTAALRETIEIAASIRG